jgi:hypothetical protein
MSSPKENPPQGQNEDTADEAMKALTHLFSSPEIATKVHYRSGIGGPTDLDFLFESVLDDVFGRETNSGYKCWVRRLYRLGLISVVPDEWKV